MATIELESAPLPKGTAGRKAREIDPEFAAILLAALTETPTVELDGEQRPNALGSSDTFESKGKAASDGRRYKEWIEKQNPAFKPRVTIVPVEVDKKPTVFKWRVYLPLSSS